MSEQSRRVAIVGAGVAGLTARWVLRRAGFAVDTFEKGLGPGGRISRRRSGEYQFDHGTQYFTATGSEFSSLVERWVADKVVVAWQPRIGTLRDGRWSEKRDGPLRYVGVPGMNEPAKALAAEVDGPVRYQCRIDSVSHHAREGWTLIDADGTRYSGYDWVIISIPPAQVLPILQVTSPVRSMLGGAVVDPCWATMLVFDRALELEYDAVFVQKGPLAWAARNSSKPGRPPYDAWVVHATAEWSRQFVDSDEQWAAGQLTEAFFAATGMRARPVLWSAAHRWRYARPRTQLPDGYWWEPAIGLGLCGDWCIGGRVESAFTSGRQLSERITARSSE